MAKFNKNIIIRYLSGESTQDEKEQLFDWLDEKEHNKRLFSEIKQIWIESQDDGISGFKSYEEAFDVFCKRIQVQKTTTSDKTAITYHNVWLKYAAGILLILGIGLGILGYQLGVKQSQKGIESTYTEIIVPLGGISSVVLPDKTLVWLHSGSKIKYENNFGKADRKIVLEGEAYFQVAKNKKIPFIVKTTYMDIKVTGTRFNVKSYPDDDKIETTLEEGSIDVTNIKGRKIDKTIVLKPKDKLTLIKKSQDISIKRKITSDGGNSEKNTNFPKIIEDVFITSDVKVEENTSWKDGVYVLDNKSLEELAKTLERRYNVSIEFTDDELKNYSYSGVLKDLTIEQVLNALRLTSQLNYEINERNVKLFKKEN